MLIRNKLNDFNEAQYSEYEVFMALNEALRYITQSQALMNSDFLEKTRRFDEDNFGCNHSFALDGIALPDDYITLVGITRPDGRKLKPTEITNIPNDKEYKITSDRLYTGAKSIVIAYKMSVPDVSNDTDYIELPTFLIDIIVKTAVMILQQAETDILMKAVDTVTRSIVPRRRYIGAEIKMPFRV